MKTMLFAFMLALAAGCSQGSKPVEIHYKSYDDCILGKLGRGQSKIASQALMEACRSKYPEPASTPPAPERTSGLFDDLIPSGRAARPQRFRGIPCTDDCSGHRAGYEWAERLQLQAATSCGGNSQSFIEGCLAWVNENGG